LRDILYPTKKSHTETKRRDRSSDSSNEERRIERQFEYQEEEQKSNKEEKKLIQIVVPEITQSTVEQPIIDAVWNDLRKNQEAVDMELEELPSPVNETKPQEIQIQEVQVSEVKIPAEEIKESESPIGSY
jgi:hypothetical protein